MFADLIRFFLYLDAKTSYMENENPVQSTNESPSNSTNPVALQQSSFQGNILLLIAALLIVIGFFLPWINTGGYGGRNYDFDDSDFGVPSINGANLISLVGKIPEIGWLLTIYLILVPLGGTIVAFNAGQRTFSEKAMMFGIASAINIPLSLFTLYLSIPKRDLFGNGKGTLSGSDFLSVGMFNLGIGFIMMVIGGAYCLIYAIGRISQYMKNVSSPQIFKYGGIGGVVTGVLIYLIMYNMGEMGGNSVTSIVFIYLVIVIVGVLLSCHLYRTNGALANYHSGIVTGFVFSGAYVFTLLIIASITSNEGTGQLGRVVIFLLVFQALFGFIITSLMAYERVSTTGPSLPLPQVPMIDTPEVTNKTDDL